jgi:AcrR family transcriptional regulator
LFEFWENNVATRERIIEAAEVLFALNGYDGTSMRDITERAEVNVAAVNYHFGSKENLLVALLDRIIAPINDERLALLASSDSDDLDSVLASFLLPDLHALEKLRDRNPDLPRFVSRMYSENSPLMHRVVGAQFAEVRREFAKAFADALPGYDEAEISFRISCVVGIVVYLFAGVQAPGVAPLTTGSAEMDLSRLLSVTRSIMTAPVEELSTV